MFRAHYRQDELNRNIIYFIKFVYVVNFQGFNLFHLDTNGTRTRATQMLTYKFVEISTPLTTAPRRLIYFIKFVYVVNFQGFNLFHLRTI